MQSYHCIHSSLPYKNLILHYFILFSKKDKIPPGPLISPQSQKVNNPKTVELRKQGFQIPKSRYFQEEGVPNLGFELLTQSLR